MNVHLDVHLDSINGGVKRWLGLQLLMPARLGLSFRLHDPRKRRGSALFQAQIGLLDHSFESLRRCGTGSAVGADRNAKHGTTDCVLG